MTKHTWRSISTVHLDPEKEEQLKWAKIGKRCSSESLPCQWRIWDTALRPKRMALKAFYPRRGYLWYTEWQLIHKIENQVQRIVKLTKNINHGNKERNLRNKSEAIGLIEDFQKQYESLYELYEDLREQVKKSVVFGVHGRENTSSSTSDSDSESYYSPGGSNSVRTPHKRSSSTSKDSDCSSGVNQEPDPALDLDDAILKDKLTSSSEVKKSITNRDPHSQQGELIFKDLSVQGNELPENVVGSEKTGRVVDLEREVERLRLEISGLRVEKEGLKEQVERESDEAMRMKEKVESLKLEISGVCMENELLREQLECKSNEVVAMQDKVESLKVEISRLCMEKERLDEQVECKSGEDMQLKEANESCFYSVDHSEDTKQKYLIRISDLEAQAKKVQLELDTLKNQKAELERRVLEETEKSASLIKGLTEQADSLQNVLANANTQKCELISELEKKAKEKLNFQIQIENLQNELSLKEQKLSKENENLKDHMHDLESRIHSLLSAKTELENQVKSLTQEASQSLARNSKLQKSLSEKENELSTERKKLTDFQTVTSTKTKSLENETKHLKTNLETVKNEKTHLQTKAESLQNNLHRLQTELDKEKEENSQNKSQVEKLSKSNFQVVERKVEEMLEEFRKQLEDKYRILSRRIRVAEQLQVENKEWYRKTKEAYEQQNKDLKARAERNEIELKNIKDMTLTANNVLTSLDSVALNFEECSANFLNRVSKASCELKFAKHWAMRKNKAVLHVRDEMDCLLAQLDDKEKEILVFREKVWKSENKARELEKMVKEKEDAMLGLKEEKREAIRQLCVWIDYHRGRSDYYMKMLSEMNPACKRAP